MNSLTVKLEKVFYVFCCFFIIGCAQTSNFAPSTYTTIFNFIGDSVFKKEGGISPEAIEGIPYASSLVNFKKSRKSLIILQSKQKDVYKWVSSDSTIFLTRNGRVIGTMGLPYDLYEVDRPAINFEEILNKGSKINYIAYYSFRKPSLNKLRVEVSVSAVGSQKIKLFNGERDLILVEERIYSQKINWKRINRFWVDPENFFVLKSEQNISPKLPMLIFEVTKKPAI